jgi:heptosyltransferase-1
MGSGYNARMRRILLVKTSSLGDVVHNLPVASDLRAHFPEAQIDWAAESSLAELPALHPAVSQVIAVEPRRWRRALHAPATWQELSSLRTLLHERAYDAVIDTQGLIKSAVIARLAPGRRYGLDFRSAREPLRLFYHRTFNVSWKLHAVERNRQLAAQALGYTLSGPAQYGIAPPALEHAMQEWIQQLDGKPYAVLLHGTSARAKLWPEHQWIKLADHVQHRGLIPVLVWGGEEERLRSERIAKPLTDARVAPGLKLSAIASLLGGAGIVFGVDTGLTHLSVALGRPTVGIYCATDPAATGLYGSMHAANVGTAEHPPPVAAVINAWKHLPS